jgi:hypothetical protein
MKKWTRESRFLLVLAALLAFAVPFAGCSSDSPTEPERTPPPSPNPPPANTYAVTVTASQTTLPIGSDESSQITVRARRNDNGALPANGTEITLTTSLGTFAGGGSSITVPLIGGQARVTLLPGEFPGTALVQAVLGNSLGQTQVRMLEQGEFFVSFVEPPQGNAGGGDVVEVVGQGFVRPVRVSFGGANAQVLSSSQFRIRVVTPPSPVAVGPGESATVNVQVTRNVNGTEQATDTLPNGFTYVNGDPIPAQPMIISVDPPNGPNEGGTRVTILGSGFDAPVRVLFGRGTVNSFNGIEATVESVTPNRIVVIVPSATGLGLDLRNQAVDVLVRNLDNGLATVAPGAFTYGGFTLNVTGISPLQGPAEGGTDVTIFGSGFSQPLQVTIAGVEQQVLSVSQDRIVFRTVGVNVNTCPANGVVVSAPVLVRLLDPLNGSGQSADNFRYVIETPRLVSASPGNASQNGGTDITLSGSGFDPPLQVRFTANGETFIANVISSSGTTVTVDSPAVTTDAFDEVSCDDDGDGTVGQKFVPTGFDIVVENLDSGCISNSLPNAVVISPTAANSTCRGDAGPPPPVVVQCNDGFDNDTDGFIDAADPQCTSPDDNDESA